jgi:murein DD-endopeptidase MepM/ murein hydrolase activator NlpD
VVNPVPGYNVSTPYGARGPYWGCDPNASGGKHTGADFAAPAGAKCVAARPGTVRHVNCGSAFGNHQVAVECNDGTRDFYAHMRSRVAAGTKVQAGDKVGEVGSEGNVSGPHLHFERHNCHGCGWSCGICKDPKPSINWQDPEDEVKEEDISAIASRVNHTLGDWTSSGDQRDVKNPEMANQRLTQIENVVRDILDIVKKIDKQVS